MNNETVRLFLGGPFVLLLLLSCFATAVLIALALRRAEAWTYLGARAVRRLSGAQLLPTLWGLSAGVLVFLLAAVLLGQPPIAWLGLLLGLAGLAGTGMGVVVAAVAIGCALSRRLGRENVDTLDALSCSRLGLSVLFAAIFLPVAGWIVVLLTAAAGVGALLDAQFARRFDASDDPR